MATSRKAVLKKKPIHVSIKKRLGYKATDSDAEVLKDWKARLARVCKPCWELKYCPFGPLVEQSPLLPPERAGMIEHMEYYKTAIATGLLGQRRELTPEWRQFYEDWIQDEAALLAQAADEITREQRDQKIAESTNPCEELKRIFHGELPPIEEYRVNYDYMDQSLDLTELDPTNRKILLSRVRERKKKIKQILKTGIDDDRRPLDEARRLLFMEQLSCFDPEDYPEDVPEVFKDGACNIFGHICPVYFTAESISETATARRRGRYIPFNVKMRVVRRDNHTCQHCGKHLRDDEVEFDHKIPISKGGSSEEHNIRLTCFDCNRDKSNSVEV